MSTEVVEADVGDVDIVDNDLAFRGLNQTKQRQGKGGFAGASSSNDSYLHHGNTHILVSDSLSILQQV